MVFVYFFVSSTVPASNFLMLIFLIGFPLANADQIQNKKATKKVGIRSVSSIGSEKQETKSPAEGRGAGMQAMDGAERVSKETGHDAWM